MRNHQRSSVFCLPRQTNQQKISSQTPAHRPLAQALMFAIGIVGSPGAFAQAEQADSSTLDEITVTAQRFEQSLQKTPVAVTALTEEEFSKFQVERLDDLVKAVPNIIIEQNTGTSSGAKIFLRGVGQDESLFTADPAVAIYVDDIYIPRQTGSQIALYDLERIEVLRGPQGTLYGRNATGGAIKYITKKPDGANENTVDVSLGNFNRRDARASFNYGLAENIHMQAAVMTKNRDGFVDNLSTATDVNDQEVHAARFSLRFGDPEGTVFQISADAVRERSGPGFISCILPAALQVARPNNPVTGAATTPFRYAACNLDNDVYTVQSNIKDLNDLDQYGLSVVSETQFEHLTWRNIVGYRKMDNLLQADFDGTTSTLLHFRQDQKQDQRSLESQLIGTPSWGNWVLGGFWFDEGNDQPTRQDVFAPGPSEVIGQDTRALALYGQLSYPFAEGWNLTAGLRYSDEEKQFNKSAVCANGQRFSTATRCTNGQTSYVTAISDSWSNSSWRLALDYSLSDNTMAYFSAATGFKSGGFNGRGAISVSATGVLSNTITTVEEETVNSFELGVKTEGEARNWRLNANFYYNDYKDLQLSALNSAGAFVLQNAADVKISGIELEGSWIPVPGLQIGANLGTINGRYASDPNRLVLPTDPYRPTELKQAPDFQGTLSVIHDIELSSALLTLSAAAHRSADYFQNVANSPLIKTHSYTLYDARVGFKPNESAWELAVVGKNLSNEEYVTGGFDIGGLGIAAIYPNIPRQYGVELSLKF
jgi:iron complex outermembrane recepter protein